MKTVFGLLLLGVVVLARQEDTCPQNQHYYSCGTSCPLTCDNYKNPPKICFLMCVPGCHCDTGYVKDENDRCVRPRDCPQKTQSTTPKLSADICNLPAETGICRGHFTRYYFDKFKRQCKRFVFGGCGGNQNNFQTLEKCNQMCQIPDKASNADCKAEPDTGICESYMERFYYNGVERQCKRFVYGGCGGNSNNFSSEKECIAICQKPSNSNL